jgi:hypothetical protein
MPDTSLGSNYTGGSTTLSPDTYNDVNINASGATLTLLAGTYYFDTLTFTNSVNLNLNLGGGDIFIYMTGNFSANNGFNVTGLDCAVTAVPSPPPHMPYTTVACTETSKVYLETLGSWTLANGATNFGKLSWFGTIVASGASTSDPNSRIRFGSEATLVGNAWARNDVITDQKFTQYNLPPTSVPEPTALLLLGSGLLFVAARARRTR